jgi:hypothetical protein
MARQHGVTANTYRRFVVDSGVVRVGYTNPSSPGTLIGATRGGTTFTVEQEIRDMPVDGAKGPVKGGRRITKVTARLECNFIEFTKELLQMGLPGSDLGSHPAGTATHDSITRALQIALADYEDSIVLIGEVSGSAQPIICGISDAIATGNFEIAAADNDESALKISFEAHFDPASLDAEPWFVYFPKDVATTEGA